MPPGKYWLRENALAYCPPDIAEAPVKEKEISYSEDDDDAELKIMGGYMVDSSKGLETKDSAHTCAARGDGGISASDGRNTATVTSGKRSRHGKPRHLDYEEGGGSDDSNISGKRMKYVQGIALPGLES